MIKDDSALALLTDAIKRLTPEEWDEIESRTVLRLLETDFDGQDTRSNRISCRSIVVNTLYDIALKP